MNARLLAVVTFSVVAAACADPPDQRPAAPTAPTPSAVVLSSLRIDITPLSGNTGLARTWRFQATARGTFSNGSTDDVTGRVTWSSSNPAVAVISSSGLLAAQGPGDTRIQAAYQGVTAVVFICIESGIGCIA